MIDNNWIDRKKQLTKALALKRNTDKQVKPLGDIKNDNMVGL